MEVLNIKLLTKDPPTRAQIVSKLVKVIEDKLRNGIKHVPELVFLKETCVSTDPQVNEIAAKGIIVLVEMGVLEPDILITDFITSISVNKITSGLVKLLSNLLFIQLDKKTQLELGDAPKYNLNFPQHPLLTLLIQDEDCATSIYNEIKSFSKFKEMGVLWNNLHYPIYLYALCNPNDKSIDVFKLKLWSYLVSNSIEMGIIENIISWMQIESKNNIQFSSELINELAIFHLNSCEKFDDQLILLLQLSILRNLLIHGLDPRDSLECIEYLIKSICDVTCINSALYILSKLITEVSPIYLLDVLQLCKLLIVKNNCSPILLQVLKSSILQWIGNPCTLSRDAVKAASYIYFFIEDNSDSSNSLTTQCYVTKKHKILLKSNFDIYMANKICCITKKFNDELKILSFLKSLSICPEYVLSHVINLVYGLFVDNMNDTEITLKSLEIIEKYINVNKKSASHVLTLILYKLSNTSNPELHLKLLKFLPKLAVAKENFPKILSSLKVLFTGSDVLKLMSMLLMYELWTIEYKCYPYLEEMLASPVETTLNNKWEFFIVKAHVVKEICSRRPRLYGKEMVAHISKMLNDASQDDTNACSTSLEAITLLCREGIIDITTTWAALEPNFQGELRTEVIKSLCGLLAQIPKLPYTEKHSDMKKQIVHDLWNYALNHEETEVKRAAFDALSAFGLENICIGFPEEYLDNDTLPDRKGIELQIQLIPGKSWIYFLRDQPNLRIAGDFLIQLVSHEIDGYLKCHASRGIQKEPMNLSNLASHSVVRGLGDYIKKQLAKWCESSRSVYLECLRILSREYSKPLPPFHWGFLQDLVAEADAKTYCVEIACHQAMVSNSARKFVETFIEGLTKHYTNEEDVLLIYKNLKYLANSIQPVFFKPFFALTIDHAVSLYRYQSYRSVLTNIIEHLKETLTNPEVQDTNKKIIVETITDIFHSTPLTNEIFDVILECVIKFPEAYLTKIVEVPVASEMTSEQFKRACAIRCALAKNAEIMPLNWFDELLDVGSIKPHIADFAEEFIPIFKSQKNANESALWIIDLIGRIETSLADSNETENMTYLIDILVQAVVCFSGFYIFIDAGNSFLQSSIELFPQATANLFDVPDWCICTAQALECFYHLNNKTGQLLPVSYTNMFGITLRALRHDDEFRKNIKWMKYLDTKVEFQ